MAPAARAWLVPPFLLVYAADVSLTILGQSAEYHAGEYSAALEANPVAYPLLARGPGCFVAAALVWGVAFIGIVVLVRAKWATWCAVLATVAHAVAGAAWLVRLEPRGWPLALAYLVAVAVVIRTCWSRAGVVTSPTRRARP